MADLDLDDLSIWSKIKSIVAWTFVKISFKVFRYYIIMKEDCRYVQLSKGTVWKMVGAGSYKDLFKFGPIIVLKNIDTKEKIRIEWLLLDDEYLYIEKSEIEAARLLYG